MFYNNNQQSKSNIDERKMETNNMKKKISVKDRNNTPI